MSHLNVQLINGKFSFNGAIYGAIAIHEKDLITTLYPDGNIETKHTYSNKILNNLDPNLPIIFRNMDNNYEILSCKLQVDDHECNITIEPSDTIQELPKTLHELLQSGMKIINVVTD
jgi:hypothetical protein